MKFLRSLFWLALFLVFLTTPWATAQNPTGSGTGAAGPAAVAPAQADPAAVLPDRVKAYYYALISGDRAAAEQMVAPESRPDFRDLRLDTLMAVKVDSMEFPPSGDSAVVTTLRTYRISNQLLDVDFRENWKLIDGQWYQVLPNPRQQETPFGKMTFPDKVDPKAMEELVKKQNKQVDPDQYIKALQRVQQEENRKEAAALAAAEAKKHPEQRSQAAVQPPAAVSPNPAPTTPPAAAAQAPPATQPPAKAGKTKKKPSKPAEKPDKPNSTATPPQP